MQMNIMHPGAFVGEHTDFESDNAYIASVLIRPKCEYTGGNLVIRTDLGIQSYYQKSHSVLIMPTTDVHEVTKVTAGLRNTICLFIG